jgi:hypothetical protein
MPCTTETIVSPSTMITKRPKRSGSLEVLKRGSRLWILRVIAGVNRSLNRPIPQRTKRQGTGMKAEIAKSTTEKQKPIPKRFATGRKALSW